MLDDNMGNPKNITNKTFEELGKENNMSPEQVKKNTMESLKKSMGREMEK